jgi:hypothetical protein
MPFEPWLFVAATLNLAQHCPHANGQRFDLAQTGEGFRIDLRFVEQQELSLGEERGKRIRQVVA